MPDSFLGQLARPRPDPGGGAAAAYGGKVALALVEKVVQLEARRPANRGERQAWEEKLAQVRRLAGEMDRLRQEDVRAYALMVTALGTASRGLKRRETAADAQYMTSEIPAKSGAGDLVREESLAQERQKAMQEAVAYALEVPKEIMARAREGLALVGWAGGRCRKHLVSDLHVARELLYAALRGAYQIARANLPLVSNESRRQDFSRQLSRAAEEGRQAFADAGEVLAGR